MTRDQKAAYVEKYGSNGDTLRQMVESTKITKITRVTKINFRPVPDQLAPVWRHRAEVYMGKLVYGDREEVKNQVSKVSREEFIERAAEKAVKKLMEQKEKSGRTAWENRVLERRYQQDEASEEALVNEVIKAEVGNNFELFGMWAYRYGVQEALQRQKMYEAKLQKERG